MCHLSSLPRRQFQSIPLGSTRNFNFRPHRPVLSLINRLTHVRGKDYEGERAGIEDPELRSFVESRWPQIRSFVLMGPVQNIYNFFFNQNFRHMINRIGARIMDSVKERFKINYSFGVILQQNIEQSIKLRYKDRNKTKELRSFHPSYNTLILDVAQLISCKEDLIQFLNSIAEENFLEKPRDQTQNGR